MKNFKILISLTIFIVFSCSKDNEEEPTGGIGLISEEAFNASIPPTYDDFFIAFQKVGFDDELSATNQEEFAKLLFDEIELNGSRNGSATGSDRDTFFSGESFMNRSEWRLALNNPIDAFEGIRYLKLSYELALIHFPCDEDVDFIGAKANAFKQAFWSATMAKNTSSDFAEQFSAAREEITKNEALKNVSLYNNNFGLQLASQFPEATNNQLFELLIQENYFYVENGSTIDADLNGLVYLNGIRDFDKTMKGSFGNPDSGGPWDISINFSQCWNTVRGRFTITRDQALQERRFSGILEDNKMTLNISDPYVFENPEGLQACVEIIMVLEGDKNELTGNWISPNCPQGGIVILK